jgi:putative transposase
VYVLCILAAVRDVWPKTREQRDWFHKLGNILDKLARRLQPRVKAALHEVMYTETRDQVRKAVATLNKDADVSRFPGGTPEAPADVERERVAVRDRAAAPAGHEGPLDGL